MTTAISKAYIAAPVIGVSNEQKQQIRAIVQETLKRLAEEAYLPWELKIPNAWNMPLSEWARCVFTQDVLRIDECDWVVVCDYGRKSSCGTAWEAGYAFAKGKGVVVVTMPGVEEVSLMVHNGCTWSVPYEKFISDDWEIPNYYVQNHMVRQN